MCSTSSLKQLRPRSSWLTATGGNALSSRRAAPAARTADGWHPVLRISSGWAPGDFYASSHLGMALNTLMSESRRVLRRNLKLVPYCTLDKAAWRFWLLSSLRAHSAPFASSPLHRISTSAARLTGAANPRRRRPSIHTRWRPKLGDNHGGHARGLPREPADQGLCV